jgi:putative MATE family efflux protein
MSTDVKKSHLILKDKNIYKGLIILSLPLMLNNLLRTLHDIVDMFFVARIAGLATESVSAIQLSFPIMFTFVALGIGISVAGTALISQFIGAKKEDQAVHYAGQLFWVAILASLIFLVLAYVSAPAVVASMGASGYVLDATVQYIRIRSFELPYSFLFFALLATRQASGDTASPVYIGGTAIILNIIFSPILIQTFNMGVAGAAYATILANLLMFPFLLHRFFFAKTGIRLDLKALKPDFPVMKEIVKVAIPASVGQSLTAVGFGVMNGIIYSLGIETVAAFGIGNRLTSLVLLPVLAMGSVISAFIGQNIGALNQERAREVFKKAMILTTGILTVGSLMMLPFREPIIKLFIQDDPVSLALAVEYLFFILVGLPLMGVFQSFLGTFNGTGYTKYTFYMAVIRLWGLRIPVTLLFREFTSLGSSGVWWSILISNFVMAGIGLVFYKLISFEPRIKNAPTITIPAITKPA